MSSDDELNLSMDEEWEAFEALSPVVEFVLPPPLVQRRPKIPVPEDLKDDKYLQRRRSNNEQAKRSRYNAKMQLEAQNAAIKQLIVDNERLEIEMNRLQETIRTLIGQVKFNALVGTSGANA
jgi:hypothetical protein